MIKHLLNLLFLIPILSFAQDTTQNNSYVYKLSMDEAIELAQLNSIASMQYKNSYTASYWNFRAYQASRLPSLMASARVGNFNHSITQLQDSETGEMNFRASNNMVNEMTISVDQVITATGGQLSLYTSLERLDQFGDNSYTNYYSQPISLSYIQPIFRYNSYKWDKEIEPKKYERAKREYLENMEQVTIFAVLQYWQYASAQKSHNIAESNFNQSKELYKTSQEKFNLGTITKTALLQLELKVLNDSLSMNNTYVTLLSTRNILSSFLGLKESTNIEVDLDAELPAVKLEYVSVLEYALKNSSFNIDQQIQMLEAEKATAQAKGERGLSMQLDARFGLSNDDDQFNRVYRNLRDQEVIGLSLSIPIYDWGLGKGRVQMAMAQAETTKNQLEQDMTDYQQDIFLKVMQFNNQRGQCDISQKAAEIAEESYNLATKNFLNGTMTVTELNAARGEFDTAQRSYVESLGDYWEYYYELRKLTLYDYVLGININTEFDKLVK